MGWGDGMAGKWLELLQETVPKLSTVAVIANPANPLVRNLVKDLKAIAPARGLKLRLIEVRDAQGALDHAFAQASRKAQAVLALPDPMIAAHLSGSPRLPPNIACLPCTTCANSSMPVD